MTISPFIQKNNILLIFIYSIIENNDLTKLINKMFTFDSKFQKPIYLCNKGII